MQLFDCSKPSQAERLPRDDDDQRQRRENRKAQSEKPKAFAAREQVFDQIDDAEPGAEQHQSAQRGPEQGAPAEAASQRDGRFIDRHRQQGRVGFRRDADRASREASRLVIAIDHGDMRIVELEGRGTAVRLSLTHCNLSPIRNWSARSRRM
jgi:hypothetical protein